MFLLLITSIIYPRIVQLLVSEKKDSLVEMMRIQGLGLSRYWMGNYIYAFCFILSVSVIYSGIAFGTGFTTGTLGIFGALIIWTHCQVCLSIFIASVVTDPLPAMLISYLIYILTAIMVLILVFAADASTGALGVGFWLFPPTGVVSIINIMLLDPQKYIYIYIL
jgi:hypothetical protein